MRITVNDTRSLAVALVRPEVDLYFNWTTQAWEQPFAAANHARALVPMETTSGVAAATGTSAATAPIFSTVQSADIGQELLSRPDAAAVLMSVSGTGTAASYAVVDVWTLPSTPQPCIGGFTKL